MDYGTCMNTRVASEVKIGVVKAEAEWVPRLVYLFPELLFAHGACFETSGYSSGQFCGEERFGYLKGELAIITRLIANNSPAPPLEQIN